MNLLHRLKKHVVEKSRESNSPFKIKHVVKKSDESNSSFKKKQVVKKEMNLLHRLKKIRG